jgi:hypothetical protein
MSRREVEAILSASSGPKYQPSLATAGKRLLSRAEHDRRASASTVQRSYYLDDDSGPGETARRATEGGRYGRGGMAEYDQYSIAEGTAPPTPVGRWIPQQRQSPPGRASAWGMDGVRAGSQRDASTEPASVHGKPLRESGSITQRDAGTDPASVHARPYHERQFEPFYRQAERSQQAERARTPDPTHRARTPEPEHTVVRNMGPRYESMGPVAQGFGSDRWEHQPPSPYASQRYAMPAAAEPSWDEREEDEEQELRQTAGPEGVHALPHKADLEQYIRELVAAKKELRTHFDTGGLAVVKKQYKYPAR